MKLLPCPFCGGTRLSICETESSWNDSAKAYAVSCASADCHGNIWKLGYHLFETKGKAIAAWNTRAEGCARDQKTTQYCAEVIGRDARIAELEARLSALLTPQTPAAFANEISKARTLLTKINSTQTKGEQK